jgi:hypothetical protein
MLERHSTPSGREFLLLVFFFLRDYILPVSSQLLQRLERKPIAQHYFWHLITSSTIQVLSILTLILPTIFNIRLAQMAWSWTWICADGSVFLRCYCYAALFECCCCKVEGGGFVWAECGVGIGYVAPYVFGLIIYEDYTEWWSASAGQDGSVFRLIPFYLYRHKRLEL